MTKIPTPAAARALSIGAAFPMCSPTALRPDASPWHVTSAVPAASYMRTRDLRPTTNHNSILTTDVVVPVAAGRDGLGAAKQAAPPRGVPR